MIQLEDILFLGALSNEEYKSDINEAARWKKELTKGKLSDAGVRKIQKSGVVKPARQWVAGVNKGSEGKIKRQNTEVKHSFVGSPLEKRLQPSVLKDKIIKNPMHAMSLSPKNKPATIFVPSGLGKRQQGISAVAKRHETDEVSAMKKIHAGGALPDRSPAHPLTRGHASDEVLRKEKELTDYGQKMYGKKLGLKPLLQAREKSGEAKLIQGTTKKEIKKREFTKPNAARKEERRGTAAAWSQQKKDAEEAKQNFEKWKKEREKSD